MAYIAVVNGKAWEEKADGELVPAADGVFEIRGKKVDVRTHAQNRALHLYLKHVAEALNAAGYDMKQVIKADISWDMLQAKEMLWKPIQKAVLGKQSTTALKKGEIDTVYHHLNRLLGEKFGIHVAFPSVEEMLFKENYGKDIA